MSDEIKIGQVRVWTVNVGSLTGCKLLVTCVHAGRPYGVSEPSFFSKNSLLSGSIESLLAKTSVPDDQSLSWLIPHLK